MGRKARTMLAHSKALESKKRSRGGRSVGLHFPFYRTYQDLQINCEGGHNEIHRLRWADDIIIKMMRLQKISLLSGRIRQPLEYPFNISTIASLKTLCPPLLCHFY